MASPKDINAKLRALTPEQARALSSHLNDAYDPKKRKTATSAAKKKTATKKK